MNTFRKYNEKVYQYSILMYSINLLNNYLAIKTLMQHRMESLVSCNLGKFKLNQV